MEKITRFFITYKTFVVFAICVFASTSLLFSNQADQILTLRSIVLDISSAATESINWFASIFNSLEENKNLREENLTLNFKNEQLKEILAENANLRNLLDLKAKEDFIYIAGEIITWNPSPTISSVTINVGKGDGVNKNMGVINRKGLVGKIQSAGRRTALVQLLTDGNFAVSAKVGLQAAKGFLEFERDDRALLSVPKSSIIAVNDTVYTSGLGNIYPEGILIGNVVEVKEVPGLFKELVVKLAVDYENLKHVLVIVNDLKVSNTDSTMVNK